MSAGKDLVNLLKESNKKGTQPYDTEATVTRVDGSTVWVHIPGGVDETPVQMTIAASKGDTVQVRVSGGKAWLVGNGTAPPTDDTTAKLAGLLASAAKVIAEKANKIAGNTAQYFWLTSKGTDTGAHITEIPKEEFLKNPSNGGGNLLARSNGIAVRDGLTELAQFGEGEVILGINDGAHSYQKLDYRSMRLVDRNGNVFFRVSDLMDEDGNIEEEFAGDGSTTDFTVYYTVSSVESVTVDGVVSSAYTQSGKVFSFDTAPSSGAVIIITYATSYDNPTLTKAFSFGQRGTGAVGMYSCAEGLDNVASARFAHAEGRDTEANSAYTHAEGYHTTAKGEYSHAEGYYCKTGSNTNGTINSQTGAHAEGYYTKALGRGAHAEGIYTEANNNGAHAEGSYTEALGAFSHAGGQHTTAGYIYQTVIGRYNNNSSSNLFEIGYGSASTPKNVMAVTTSGNTTIAGTLTQSSDKRLKEHIDYLSDDAVAFIQSLKPAHYTKDGKNHVGFYAQDVEEADAWGCMTGEMNGYKTLGYTELIAPLVAYCQKLESRIAELENKMTT